MSASSVSPMPPSPHGRPPRARSASLGSPLDMTANRVHNASLRALPQQTAVPVTVGSPPSLSGRSQPLAPTGPLASAGASAGQRALGTPGTRVLVQQRPTHANLQLSRQTRSVSVWSSYRATINTTSFDAAKKAIAEDLYARLEELFISRGLLPEDAKDFSICLTRKSGTYKDENDVEHEFSYLKIMEDDPEVESLIDEIQSFVDGILPIGSAAHRPEISSTSKGNVRGDMPCRRNTDTLRKIPSDFSRSSEIALGLEANRRGSNGDTQKAAMLRTTIAQEYHSGIVTILDDLFSKKQKELADLKAQNNPSNQPAITVLENDLRKIRKAKEKAKPLDGLAVSASLCFAPIGGDRNARHKSANEVQSAIESYHKAEFDKYEQSLANPHRDKGKMSRFWHTGMRALGFESSYYEKPDFQNEKDYSFDVGGLIFATSALSQTEYYDYCMDHGVSMKQEGLEDVIVREVLKMIEDTDHYDPDSGLEFILKDLSPAVRALVVAEMQKVRTKCKQIKDKAATATVDPKAKIEEKWKKFRADVIPQSATPGSSSAGSTGTP